jgi:hypothetical protein
VFSGVKELEKIRITPIRTRRINSKTTSVRRIKILGYRINKNICNSRFCNFIYKRKI